MRQSIATGKRAEGTPSSVRSAQTHRLLACSLVAVSLFANGSVAARTFSALYRFGAPGDGIYPGASLAEDSAGNLYGTTIAGGTGNCNDSGYGNGCGTVFELTPDGTETVLYSFMGGSDGSHPMGALKVDASANLYGTTYSGGNGSCGIDTLPGCGTVFEIPRGGGEKLLDAFQSSNGAGPEGALVADDAGNMYGTTIFGGSKGKAETCREGCGVLFALAPDNSVSALHQWSHPKQTGGTPGPDVILRNGVVYGTVENGTDGTNDGCCGAVFQIGADGKYTVLHAFTAATDGEFPDHLVSDKAGNLYGTTQSGGQFDQGTVFKLTTTGIFTVLHAFAGYTDGSTPTGLTIDKAGNLFGTTARGGDVGQNNSGTIFEISASGTESLLYTFQGYPFGGSPSGLLIDKRGNLFGTALMAGVDGCYCGMVYELTK